MGRLSSAVLIIAVVCTSQIFAVEGNAVPGAVDPAVVTYNGNVYRTITGVDPDATYYDFLDTTTNEVNFPCQSDFMPLPDGWMMAPNNNDTAQVIKGHIWGGYYIIVSGGVLFATGIAPPQYAGKPLLDSQNNTVTYFLTRNGSNVCFTYCSQYSGGQILIRRCGAGQYTQMPVLQLCAHLARLACSPRSPLVRAHPAPRAPMLLPPGCRRALSASRVGTLQELGSPSVLLAHHALSRRSRLQDLNRALMIIARVALAFTAPQRACRALLAFTLHRLRLPLASHVNQGSSRRFLGARPARRAVRALTLLFKARRLVAAVQSGRLQQWVIVRAPLVQLGSTALYWPNLFALPALVESIPQPHVRRAVRRAEREPFPCTFQPPAWVPLSAGNVQPVTTPRTRVQPSA